MTDKRNTISDAEWADLQRRGRDAAPPMFSPKAVDQRLKSREQQQKAQLS